MEKVLFLAHRLPYPPNKGDKVRSYNFFTHLVKTHKVYLGTFIDDEADWKHVPAVKALCDDVHVESLDPLRSRLTSTAAFLTREPVTLPYFRSKGLQRWVDDVVGREGLTRAFVFSSPMAQYVIRNPQMRCYVDFVDLDSAKWQDYADRRPWPVSAFYEREARHLLAYEKAIAARAHGNLFVTEQEAALFRKSAPDCARRITSISNGVDGEYFSPSRMFASPFKPDERPIVFTGAMDYWPNVDAVCWFARQVLPDVIKRDPRARFYIVGMNPSSSVRALARDSRITVTGRVDDVRPYLQYAQVVVAPLRVARGIQNKVLEAMAMARPVVVTQAAAVSLSVRAGIDLEVASDAPDFAFKAARLMGTDNGARMGHAARVRVLSEYSWKRNLELLDDWLAPRGKAPAEEGCSPAEPSYPTAVARMSMR